MWTYNVQTQQIVQRDSRNCLTAAKEIQGVFDQAKFSLNRNTLLRMLGADVEGKNKDTIFNIRSEKCGDKKGQRWLLIPLSWK